jgi:HK97 gp10 family phage protein
VPNPITVEGLEDLERKVRQMMAAIHDEDSYRILGYAAENIRDEARHQAPVGNHLAFSRLKRNSAGGITGGVTWEPGRLRRSIVSYKGKRSIGTPAAFARVNVFKGNVRAPHGHLVEFGTKVRRPRNAKWMTFLSPSGSRWIRAKQVKAMPANPFFERAVKLRGPSALDDAAAKYLEKITKAAQK